MQELKEEIMLKLYFLLYYEFLKIGVFAIGGGYAALPFLYYVQEQYKWFTIEELTNMIAVSNITPGPILSLNILDTLVEQFIIHAISRMSNI